MGTRPRRREPRQERSRAMVARILDAGLAVLLEHGYDRASTGRVAACAGISPGSLYQYFEDKHELLAEVIERETERLRTRISGAFVRHLAEASVLEIVRANVVTLLDTFEANAGLLRVLYEQLPPSADAHRTEFKHRVDELMTTALRLRVRGPGGERVDAIAWVLVRAVENVTINYVLDPPAIGRDAVIDELTTLISTYLTGSLEDSARDA